MKLSIIIPIYNCEKYLKRCLDSLLSQTFTDYEVIMVNDGSTDNSVSICNIYIEKDKRFKLVQKQNGGLSSARNMGLEKASGEYFFFIDPDDWIDKDYFEKCISDIVANDVDVLFTPYVREYKNRVLSAELLPKKIIWRDVTVENNFVLRRLIGMVGFEKNKPARIDNFNTAWGKFYRSSLFKSLRFVDTELIRAEDLWFNILVFKKVNSYEYYPRVNYHYFKENQSSITKTKGSDIFKQYSLLYEMINKEIRDGDYSDDYREALNNRIIFQLITVVSLLADNSKKLKLVLNSKLYRDNFRTFSFKYLPLQYKVFFVSCKYRFVFILRVIYMLANRIRYSKQ